MERRTAHGLNDANWANARLQELSAERASLVAATRKHTPPPQIDAGVVMDYRRQAEKLFKSGLPAELKRLLSAWKEEVVLKPEDREVIISYSLPETVMKGLVAGDCNAPNALFVQYRLSLTHSVC